MTSADRHVFVDWLLPCPFDGSRNVYIHTKSDSEFGAEWYARCDDCGVWGPICDTPGEAAAAWNHRA